MEPTAAPDGPAFYFDLFSPEAYLAAERVIGLLPVSAEWIPVSAAGLPAADTLEGWRCDTDREAFFDRIARVATRRGLQPLVWPQPFPTDSRFAMLVATYAKQIGRTVPFALAAYRQAFAGGRDLAIADNVLIAAAACEMHPNAVLKAAELRSVGEALERTTAEAAELGIASLPAIWSQGGLFSGLEALDAAARSLVR
ncbi:MAG: DsbA family protein [Solirubrobacterales bacterium]|nr:DsbA family protein [Solirubrobacterales bacterium]